MLPKCDLHLVKVDYRVAKTHRGLKLQVISRKRATNHRALLRKITYEDKASYDSTPPCIHKDLMNIHTGCQSPTRCRILQVSFCKLATNYKELLRKETCKDMCPYRASPHCTVGGDTLYAGRPRLWMSHVTYLNESCHVSGWVTSHILW